MSGIWSACYNRVSRSMCYAAAEVRGRRSALSARPHQRPKLDESCSPCAAQVPQRSADSTYMTMELPRDLNGAAQSPGFSPVDPEVAASLSSLCSLLWQERVSLEVILFKLVEEQLIAAQGH